MSNFRSYSNIRKHKQKILTARSIARAFRPSNSRCQGVWICTWRRWTHENNSDHWPRTVSCLLVFARDSHFSLLHYVILRTTQHPLFLVICMVILDVICRVMLANGFRFRHCCSGTWKICPRDGIYGFDRICSRRTIQGFAQCYAWFGGIVQNIGNRLQTGFFLERQRPDLAYSISCEPSRKRGLENQIRFREKVPIAVRILGTCEEVRESWEKNLKYSKKKKIEKDIQGRESGASQSYWSKKKAFAWLLLNLIFSGLATIASRVFARRTTTNILQLRVSSCFFFLFLKKRRLSA